MLNIVIPLAGEGSRFSQAGFTVPKPLIKVEGKTLIEHSIESLGLKGRYIFITKKYGDEDYNDQLTGIFTKLCPNFLEVTLSFPTTGAATSALFAQNLVDPTGALIVTNSDQYLDWDPADFMSYIEKEDPDLCIGVYKSSDPKNSFAKIENDEVVELVEKIAVSDVALTGFHYWKDPKEFFSSAKELVNDYESMGYKEPYVSLTYNYLLKNGKKVSTYEMPGFQPLGTPADIDVYTESRRDD